MPAEPGGREKIDQLSGKIVCVFLFFKVVGNGDEEARSGKWQMECGKEINVLFGIRLVACIVYSLVSSKTIKIYLFMNLGGGQTFSSL